jgi:hypothetical protein
MLLMSEEPKVGKDTEFGRYFHAQLLSSKSEYTTA